MTTANFSAKYMKNKFKLVSLVKTVMKLFVLLNKICARNCKENTAEKLRKLIFRKGHKERDN